MGEWISIEEWPDCVRLERPGIVFEIRNRDGQTLLTPCVVPLPDMPFDWTSPAESFRSVSEAPAVHSEPLPAPAEETK
jgi:hypothetical protein